MREFFKNSFPYFKKYMPVHALATVFGLFRMVILLVTPQIVSLLVDRVVNPLLGAEPSNTSSIFTFLIRDIPADDYVKIFTVLGVTLAVFAVLFFLCFWLKWNLAHNYSLKSEKKMRADALAKVTSASPSLLAKYTAGDLILITTKDPSDVRDMYIARAQFMSDNLFYIVTCSVFLGLISPWLLFLPLAGGFAAVGVMLAYSKPIGKYFDDVWESESALSTTVQESVYGVRTVASFAKERERKKHFNEDNEGLRKTYYRGIRIFANRHLFTQIIHTVIFLGEVAFGIWLGVTGKLTAGEFTAMVGYLGTLVWQISGLLFNLNRAQRSLVSGKRLFGFLNAKDEVAEKYGTAVPSAKPSISLRGVSVKSGEGYALCGVDLEIPYGKKLGVMGRTGSGKTLLVKLMQGLAEADEGEILIDGKEIHEYSQDALLHSFSYAMQNVFLFSNTIAANISLYNPFGSSEEIQRAGALAEVDEFARRFPEGYDTTIGEKGFGLSGGQKQRISIARALYKNADIFVFDDVTSALDLETERAVFNNLTRECGERTQVIVTHRATALKSCDEILFLEKGEICERGTFDELIALNGNFAEIYNRQVNEVVYED